MPQYPIAATRRRCRPEPVARAGPGVLALACALGAAGLALLPAAAAAAAWPLDRVLAAVRQRDPGVRVARAQADVERAQGHAAYSALSPRVDLRLGAARSDDPAWLFSERLRQGNFTAADFELAALNQPAPRTALEWSIALEQPIWNGAREITAPARAGHLGRAARAGGEAAVADQLLLAVEAYVEALRADRALAADSAGLAAAEEGARAAAARFRMDQVPELDTLRAAARCAEARATWLDARKASEVALARLSARVGEEVHGSDLESVPTPELPDSASLVAAGPTTRGESRAARERAAVYSLESRNAGLSLLPSINFRASLDQYRDALGTDFERRYMVGVSLDLPLWDGARRLSEWHEAQARSRAAAAMADAIERRVQVEAIEARSELGISAERLEAARLGRAAAEEALRLALDRYRAGLLPLGEWLDAEAEAARARARHVDAEAQRALAGYRYQHAIGALQ